MGKYHVLQMMMKQTRHILQTLVLAVALLAAGQSVWAQSSGWTVTNTDNTFTIQRSDKRQTETVYYRTVSLSALGGENYTTAWNILTFQTGVSKKEITVEEPESVRDARFRFHNGAGRSYRFEVLDKNFETVLASCVRNTDDSNRHALNANYLNKGIVDLVKLRNGSFTSGLGANRYFDIVYSSNAGRYFSVEDDIDYKKESRNFDITNFTSKVCTANDFEYLMPYLDFSGAKLYATVCFTQKEVQDGYQYIQILADQETQYDGKDPDGKVNTPVKSVYKACFEGYKGGNSVPDNEYKWFFPHRSDDTYNTTEFSHANNYLYQQAFQPAEPSFRAASSGSLVFSPRVAVLTVRFDANGSGGDTWRYKDLFVRLALADDTAPTVLDRSVTVTAYPYRDSPATISVPFSEVVVVEGTPTLTTNWGSFTYDAGSGSNVLSFSGTINASPGTTLSVTGLSGTVKDLAGNAFTWSGTRSGRTVMARDALEELETDSQGRFVISSREVLYKIAKIVNAGESFEGRTLIVTADIAYNQSIFQPIGTKAHPFNGTFDGDGHVISGIVNSGEDFRGLFGYVVGGTVKNVILSDCTFSGNNYVGSIAGYMDRGTVSNCVVEPTVTLKAGSDAVSYHGGIVGYVSRGTVEGCRCAASLNLNGHTGCTQLGGIVGRMEGTQEEVATHFSSFDLSWMQGCLYVGHSVPDGAGAIYGSINALVLHSKCFYTDTNISGGTPSGDESGACLARTITLGNGVGIKPMYSGATTWALSGITDDATVLYDNGTCYSGVDQMIELRYTGSVPAGYEVVFSVNGEAIAGDTFTMPAADVTVTAAVSLAASLRCGLAQGTKDGVTAWWGTFYHDSFRYTLPEGAAAYTMGSDKHLYRLGDDGRTIPANTAVIIISDGKDIILSLDSGSASDVIDHAPGGNILRGGPLTVSSLPAGQSAYILGTLNGALGFYAYTGTSIPANKAYYVQ